MARKIRTRNENALIHVHRGLQLLVELPRAMLPPEPREIQYHGVLVGSVPCPLGYLFLPTMTRIAQELHAQNT